MDTSELPTGLVASDGETSLKGPAGSAGTLGLAQIEDCDGNRSRSSSSSSSSSGKRDSDFHECERCCDTGLEFMSANSDGNDSFVSCLFCDRGAILLTLNDKKAFFLLESQCGSFEANVMRAFRNNAAHGCTA